VKKISCLFERDFKGPRDAKIRRDVTAGCEWVLAGEGIATEKFDGTACMLLAGVLYKRYDAKRGKQPPSGAIPCQDPDPVTGHWPHWVAISADKPEDRWHREGLAWLQRQGVEGRDGTYELVGPSISANPHKLSEMQLWRHGSKVLPNVPRDFDGLREYLASFNGEGIVFHHPDGRMVKIRRTDFDFPWNAKK
jgi:hypothetical protein